ncbi:unnamed protein product [Lota lota]
MGEITQHNPKLDLHNFEESPRSTESRARSGVKKPVELLIRSLNELVAESCDNPYEAVTVMHETYEKQRRKLLQLCREGRERIVKEGPGALHLPALEVVGKAVRSTSDCSSPHSDADNSSPAPQDCGGQGFISSSTLGKPPPSTPTNNRNCESSSLRPGNHNNHNNHNNMVSTSSSHSLGDLRHSPATQTQLEKLVGDIHQKLRVMVSEKDRKIAALMLVKHQQEMGRLSLRKQEEREREEARSEEAARRAQEEKSRRRRLRQGAQRWRQETEALSRSREQRHQELVGLRERHALLQEERWLRSKEELEARRRETTEAARREAQSRKRCQERLLRGREEAEETEREREAQRALEREQKAKRAKATRQRREQNRRSQGNHRELLQHVLQKQRGEQQVQQEETTARRAMEKRLRRAWEEQARASEGRRRELRERGSLQAEHIQQARAHAELRRDQQLRHKQLLVQLSQRRMDRAALEVSAQIRAKAQQTRQHNLGRRLCHQQLREKVRREEEARREAVESQVMAKERRRRELLAQREQTLEEARRGARASFRMRESVREQTVRRTFDRMALEARLCASLAGVKL